MIYRCETHDFPTDSTHEIVEHTNNHAGCKLRDTRITSDNADIVSILVGLSGKPIQFTNLPMHHVHAAIAVLNGDPYADALKATENNPQAQVNYLYGKDADGNPLAKFYPPYVAEGTKEFTPTELFPNHPDEPWRPQEYCEECGALVPYERARDKHVTWHNKTLP